MAAARLSVGLQAVLVMSLLLLQIMPFLPCTLATGGKSVELLMGRETHEGRHRLLAPSKLIWSRRILVGEPWTGPAMELGRLPTYLPKSRGDNGQDRSGLGWNIPVRGPEPTAG
uniref:Uncharacterized protein n=1 Tax=Oryza nivara TaxID=4536 RepID=A0A0E0G2S6_ORYNI